MNTKIFLSLSLLLLAPAFLYASEVTLKTEEDPQVAKMLLAVVLDVSNNSFHDRFKAKRELDGIHACLSLDEKVKFIRASKELWNAKASIRPHQLAKLSPIPADRPRRNRAGKKSKTTES